MSEANKLKLVDGGVLAALLFQVSCSKHQSCDQSLPLLLLPYMNGASLCLIAAPCTQLSHAAYDVDLEVLKSAGRITIQLHSNDADNSYGFPGKATF
jgi:hypothetical protein